MFFSFYLIFYNILNGERRKLTVKNDFTSWELFTRVMSSFNALRCARLVFRVLAEWNPETLDLLYPFSAVDLKSYTVIYSDLPVLRYFFPETILFQFCNYLLVDGIFMLWFEFSHGRFTRYSILSVLHHFVGGLGIFLIALNEKGLLLGLYFCCTEISTPFLHVSWLFRKTDYKTYTFSIFYVIFFLCRICTIPFLLYYLNMNEEAIYLLPALQYYMVYYGSYCLIFLNIVWFILMTIKLFR